MIEDSTSRLSSSLSSSLWERTVVIACINVPWVEECASSITTAKVLCLIFPNKSCWRIWKNLWIVVTTILVFPLSAEARSEECDLSSMTFTCPALWGIPWIASCSWRSTTIRSVTIRTVSKIFWFSLLWTVASVCASHEMVSVFPLPAECSIK